ncbi:MULTISPECIES: HIRAN domain-containing protein [unclassified Enterococcus]|uniref:HIRAN domain-containing protein n=1 Tax=unclassified Enterococcus TaxID=2608891 RepID=UPI001CE10849|nr:MULTISPECIES: HIRAN domain-containing protein [unclassified Enterococcus]MCA5011986.1 DNA-binding protein [Enterococcus sp. S23]MCA5015237.1 DNA-binding protein [Enterococcus sp. S22(2020)]
MNKKLCLLWQNTSTRQWYHVGNLEFTANDYLFYYEIRQQRRGVQEALDNGYQLHPAFPDLKEKYRANRLFNTFSRRLPNFKRADIKEKYSRLGFENSDDAYELFVLTGGKLAGDNYEFVKPVERSKDGKHLAFDFYVRGLRHYTNTDFELPKGARLNFRVDKKNEYDGCAVEVICNDKRIGYVPAFYSPFIKQALENNEEIVLGKVTFDSQEASRFRMLMEVTIELSESNHKVNVEHCFTCL